MSGLGYRGSKASHTVRIETTPLKSGSHFLIRAFIDGNLDSNHVRTAGLGDVIKTRNAMCDYFSGRSDVEQVEANAIPWPVGYVPDGKGAWGGKVPK